MEEISVAKGMVIYIILSLIYLEVYHRRIERMLDKTDVGFGAVAAILAGLFGEYWILPAGLIALNVVDYATGTIKARKAKRSSSMVGANGIVRKVAIWIVIALSFYAAFAVSTIGDIFGYDLHFALSFGWLTLSMYLVNEMRSILENLVEMGVEVPSFLIKGLDITRKLIDAKAKEQEEAMGELEKEEI